MTFGPLGRERVGHRYKKDGGEGQTKGETWTRKENSSSCHLPLVKM